MTLQSLARTIAKARHGTDAMTVKVGGGRIDAKGRHHIYPEREVEISRKTLAEWVQSVIAQPDGAQ